ncbi:MAG: hypothetical protein QNJ72_37895 [Pleurocapsa sp. MO_226.B13]|nr:hypothetical protein [Pleurocapsa sp. MO_226.B13]
MFLSNSYKSFFLTTSVVVGGFVFSSLAFTSSVAAFSVTFDNQGFEDTVDEGTNNLNDNPASGWEGTGDVYIDNSTGFSQISPVSGNSQAVITTGRDSEVDDPATSAGTFNLSGFEPVTATSDSSADALQDFLGLPTGALSISRSQSADNSKSRTAKEGSGIYQDISVTFSETDISSGYNVFELDFNWAYLTNDGIYDSRLGEQDFAFFTIFEDPSSTDTNVTNAREITALLDSSAGGTSSLSSGETNFQQVNTTNYDQNNLSNNYTYTSEPVTTAGTYTYRVGFGVVDVDGVDRTSALVLDNFSVQQVPFDFSPTAGIAVVLSCSGFSYLRRKFKI